MLKPWSISTTERSPARLRSFLAVLRELEGAKWNNAAQIDFQIRLIQSRVYGAEQARLFNGLPRRDITLLQSGREISYARAEEIFWQKKYNDPPLQGRVYFSPLQKFGFAMLGGCGDDIVRITGAGKQLLREKRDAADIFLRFFLKWQLPNPLDENFPLALGYSIKPFVGVLHLIDAVNKLSAKSGGKEKGLSIAEFRFFAPALISWKWVMAAAEAIILLRKKTASKPAVEKNAYWESEAKRILRGFDLTNIRDHADNIIRYFFITKYLCLRAAGTHIDIAPGRKYEVKYLLGRDDGAADIFESSYLHYLEDATVPRLPGETKVEVTSAIRHAQAEIKKLDKHFVLPPFADAPPGALKKLRDKRRAQLVKLSRRQTKHLLKQPDEAKKLLAELRDLARGGDTVNTPLRLQYLVSAALDGIWNDAKAVRPNYPTDDRGQPTSTAPGGVADIECFYENFSAICEVTLTTGSDQWMREALPAMRHLADFQNGRKEPAEPAYCLFVAPSIHQDSLNAFQFSAKRGFAGKKQKIVPLTIGQFCDVASFCAEKTRRRQPIKSGDIMRLFNLIADSVKLTQTTPARTNAAPKILEQWKQTV